MTSSGNAGEKLSTVMNIKRVMNLRLPRHPLLVIYHVGNSILIKNLKRDITAELSKQIIGKLRLE
jgi:hypothetical protein